MTTPVKKKYSKEFKLDAISLILEQGYSQTDAASSLNINANMLGRWIKEHQNGNSRTIPLSEIAIAALGELIKASTTDRVLKFSSSCISHRFNRDCKQAGIEGMVLHSLRHGAVSKLFEKGLKMMKVTSISGHKDLSMLKRYTHINPEMLLARL